MATIADLQTVTDEALAALRSSDWETVLQKCDEASMIIATIPRTVFDGGDTIEFKPADSAAAIAQIRARAQSKLDAAKPFMISTPLRYTRR